MFLTHTSLTPLVFLGWRVAAGGVGGESGDGTRERCSGDRRVQLQAGYTEWGHTPSTSGAQAEGDAHGQVRSRQRDGHHLV